MPCSGTGWLPGGESILTGFHGLEKVSSAFVVDCFDFFFFLEVVLVRWRFSDSKVAKRARMRLSNSVYMDRIYYSRDLLMSKSSAYLM